MFTTDSTHKPLPHIKRRRGESPPKIGSGQILKETSIYRVQWHSYFPEKWIKDTCGTNAAPITSRGRITSQGWVVAITDSESEDHARDLYIWHRSGKETCSFSLYDMKEANLATAPERVCPIFEILQNDEAEQLLGLTFVSSNGVVRFWSDYTDALHFKSGAIPLLDLEECTCLVNAHVPNTVSLVCGTSLGRIFLLRCTDANNTPCDAIVSEVVRPQGMMTRLFRFGGQQASTVKRVISLQKFESSVDNCGTFVLTETSLSFWRLNANYAHTFLWEDKLTNILVQFPGARFLDVVCRKEESTTHELLLLCRYDTLCFVAVLDVFDASSKPQLARCVECTVPPRENSEDLRIVSVEGSILAAFIIGALSVTNVPFNAVDGKEKDHVFNRVERKALSCLGGGVHDGAVYVLAEGYGVLTLQSLRPAADKHLRAEDEEDEKHQPVEESNTDIPRQLATAFGLYLDRTKIWEHKAQQLLQLNAVTINQAVLTFTQDLVQARPKTEYTASMDFAILRHHMIQKRTNYQEFLTFLQQSSLWDEKLNEQTQLLFLEMGEKLTITEKFWETFQEAETQNTREGKAARDSFLQKVIDRGVEDGLSDMEVFFSDALNIGNVILKLKKILPSHEIEYGGSEQIHAALLQRYLIANTCLEVILWEGLKFRQSHAGLPVVRPWTCEDGIFAALREYAKNVTRLLQIVKSEENLLKLREMLFDGCYRVFRGCLSQKPPSSRDSPDFDQDVSYLVGVLEQASESLEGKDLATDLVISLAGEFLECRQLVYLCPVKSSRPMVTEGKGENEDDAINWHCLRSHEGFYYANSATKQVTTIQPACFADDKLVDFLRSKCSKINASSHQENVTEPLIALLQWFRPRNLGKFTSSLFIAYIEKRRLSAVALSVSDVLSQQLQRAGTTGLLPAYPFGGTTTITDTQCAAVFYGSTKQLLEDYNALLRAFLVNRKDLAWLHAIHEKDFAACTTALLDSAEELTTAQQNTRFNLAFLASRIAPIGTESERLTLAQAQQYFTTAQQHQPIGKRVRALDGDMRAVASPQQLCMDLGTLGTSTRDAQAIVCALEVYQLLGARHQAQTEELVQLWQEVYEADQPEWQTIARARDNDLNSQLPDQVCLTLFYQVLRAWTRKTSRAVSGVLLAALKTFLETLDPPVRRAYELVLLQPISE